MIVITGAAGFIGSYFAKFLNGKGISNLILVDHIEKKSTANLHDVKYEQYTDRNQFLDSFESHAGEIEMVFHLGARTDTTEKDELFLKKWNTDYSKQIWKICTKQNIPLIYASSAATYGNGEFGYEDKHSLIPSLKPLNPYGWSKQYFDEWVLKETETPTNWYGFKFFNVFGPHENHKGRMASVVYHGYHQIKKTNQIKLFKSNEPDLADGHQKRDFIYVDDVAKMMYSFYLNKPQSGIYNLGTAHANTFVSLATELFTTMNQEVAIEFIPFPEDLQNVYQNFTEANMQKTLSQVPDFIFTPFDIAIQKYVEYLENIY